MDGRSTRDPSTYSRLAPEEIRKRVRATHAGKYTFPNLVAESEAGMSGSVTLRCKQHGLSTVKIRSILHNGSGCNECGVRKPRKYDTARIIALAREHHGDKYDYSETVFTNIVEKIRIICPKHGAFEQAARDHAVRGRGCFRCGKESMGIKLAGSVQRNLRSQKSVKIDGSSFHTDSHGERVTVELLCKKHGAAAVLDQHHVPVIKYEFGGRSRAHRPDFVIPSKKILVEVKSPMTVGAQVQWNDNLKPLTMLRQLIAKSHAARNAGYQYRVVVVLGRAAHAKPVPLPRGWEETLNTPTKMRKFLEQHGKKK